MFGSHLKSRQTPSGECPLTSMCAWVCVHVSYLMLRHTHTYICTGKQHQPFNLLNKRVYLKFENEQKRRGDVEDYENVGKWTGSRSYSWTDHSPSSSTHEVPKKELGIFYKQSFRFFCFLWQTIQKLGNSTWVLFHCISDVDLLN